MSGDSRGHLRVLSILGLVASGPKQFYDLADLQTAFRALENPLAIAEEKRTD